MACAISPMDRNRPMIAMRPRKGSGCRVWLGRRAWQPFRARAPQGKASPIEVPRPGRRAAGRPSSCCRAQAGHPPETTCRRIAPGAGRHPLGVRRRRSG
eukprot:5650805-Heterocapsa_arctica.AAC.1